MSKWIWTVIACVAVGAVAFFGGVFVGRLTAPSGFNRAGGLAGFGGGQNGARAGGGFATGKVLKSDSSGLTLQLTDGGGTKNVIIDSSTQVIKSEVASASAISVGTTVTAIGTAGSDGSITARAVTIGGELGGMRGLFGGGGGGGGQGPGGQGGGQGGQNGGQGPGGQGGGQGGGPNGGGPGGPPPGQ
jgi:hypothetical protein